MVQQSIACKLAFKILFSPHRPATTRLLGWLCFFSIALSSFTLLLVIGIMQGFQDATQKTLQGALPQITLSSPHFPLDDKAISAVLTKEFPEIEIHAPATNGYGILQQEETDSLELQQLITIRGIVPEKEFATCTVAPKVTLLHSNSVQEALTGNQVIIGSGYAERAEITPGETAIIYVPKEVNKYKKTVSFTAVPVVIAGTITTGITEIDNELVLCNLAFAQQAMPHAQVYSIACKAKQGTDEKVVLEKLQKRFIGMTVFSWREPYAPIVAALTLETYAAFITLLLLVIIACSNLIAFLTIIITQKQKIIATLLLLGATQRHIKIIFFTVGGSITASATLCGIVAAYIAGYCLTTWLQIPLPESVYFTNTLPIIITPFASLLIFFAALCCGLFASYVALKTVTTYQPAVILKNP